MSKINKRKKALVAEIQVLKAQEGQSTPNFIRTYKGKLTMLAFAGGVVIGFFVVATKKSKKKKQKHLKKLSPLWVILIPVAQWGLKRVIKELSQQVDYQQLYQLLSNKIMIISQSIKNRPARSTSITSIDID